MAEKRVLFVLCKELNRWWWQLVSWRLDCALCPVSVGLNVWRYFAFVCVFASLFDVRERSWIVCAARVSITNMIVVVVAAVCRLRCLIDLLPLIFFLFVFVVVAVSVAHDTAFCIKCICNKFNWNVPPRCGATEQLTAHMQQWQRRPRPQNPSSSMWCNIFIIIK